MKQETLEEAKSNYASYNFDSSFLNIDDHFEAGAKWQKEQDKKFYSEEEVINAFNEGQALNVRGKLIQGKEWLKQLKQKNYENRNT
jgi:hypothetical protein